MIHTATINILITDAELLSFLKKNSHKNPYFSQNEGECIFNLKLPNGINSIRIKTWGKETFEYNWLYVEINLYNLMHNYSLVKSMRPYDKSKLNKAFNTAIKKVHEKTPLLSEYSVNRIDYCIDIYTKYIKLYILLLNKGKSKIHSMEKKNYTKGTGTYLKGDNTTINIYDKHQELIDRKADLIGVLNLKYPGKAEEMYKKALKSSENMLRFEVQCNKKTLDNTAEKYGFKNKGLMSFVNNDICFNIVGQLYKNLINSGDFYELNECKKQILSLTGKHKEVIDRYIKLVDDISTAKCLAKYYDKYIDRIEKLQKERTFKNDDEDAEICIKIRQIKNEFKEARRISKI